MTDAKYQRGKIYTIRSHKTPLIYVGSTCQKYLSSRMTDHRGKFKAYKNGKANYRSSFDIIEIDENCYIELYEDYPCNNRRELEKREGEVIRSLDCCNKNVVGRTKKEYYKQYYVNNKEKITARDSQKYQCECGGKYIHQHKARHMKSKKHQKISKFH
jgi:hypothetical protein